MNFVFISPYFPDIFSAAMGNQCTFQIDSPYMVNPAGIPYTPQGSDALFRQPAHFCGKWRKFLFPLILRNKNRMPGGTLYNHYLSNTLRNCFVLSS